MNDHAAHRSQTAQNALAILVSILVGGVFMLASAFPFAWLLLSVRAYDRESLARIPAVIMVILAGFIAGRLAASFSTLKGWVCGVITALGLFLLIRLIIGGTFFSVGTLLNAFLLLFSGVAGGLSGAVKR